MDVLSEAKSFESQYPQSPALPQRPALRRNGHGPEARPGGRRRVAGSGPGNTRRKRPAPFALFYIVNIYERQKNTPAMIQAAADFRAAFPQSYTLLAQTADAVSTVLLKEKKFDDAIGLYQPLTAMSPSRMSPPRPATRSAPSG